MIEPITPIVGFGSASTQSAQPAANASGLTSDFETFLKMLTAQARYQDPLEPIDSTEFAAQLAQFSMVEQQVQTNDTLSQLAALLGAANMASLAGWVGMEARAETPAYFDGTPITVAPSPARAADQAFLVVTDTSGAEVHIQQIPVSADPIQWAGVDDDGTPFGNGVYDFHVESFSNGGKIQSGATEVYSRISEAQLQGNTVVLVLRGGQEVPVNAVSALRK